MNKIFNHITLLLVMATAMLSACYEDEGNYSFNELQTLTIDTIGVEWDDKSVVNYGDTLEIDPNVTYEYPEQLAYYWLLVPYPYETVTVGNTEQYPAPDTIGREKKLFWQVDVEPGDYLYYIVVIDTVFGAADNMKVSEANNLNVQSANSFTSLICLSEYSGQSDIDVYYTPLALIFGGETETQYYSNKFGETIPGAPTKLGYYQSSYNDGFYYPFTDQGGLRIDRNEFMTVDTYDEMFYSSPSPNVQAYQVESSNELMINDGKLHVLNNAKANDRKFSGAIAGDYDALSYFASDLDNELTVIFDKNSKSFMRYYNSAGEVTPFGASSGDATVSPNNLPNVPVAIMTYDYSKTCAILEDTDGKMKAYLYNFNSANTSDYSAAGESSIIDLSACEGIEDATIFYAGSSATAFHYATSTAVYTFSISSGSTTATKIYDLPAGEEVTAMYSLPMGGFPTAGRVYWIATWNQTAQDGSIVEFEIDPNSGEPDWFWGMMLGIDQPNPNVTSGFGKIKDMVVGI